MHKSGKLITWAATASASDGQSEYTFLIKWSKKKIRKITPHIYIIYEEREEEREGWIKKSKINLSESVV